MVTIRARRSTLALVRASGGRWLSSPETVILRGMRNMTYGGAAAAALLILLNACSSSAQQATQMSPTDVVATVGSTRITLGEVDEQALQSPASSFGSARLVQALYLARRDALDELIGKRLMDAEAKARSIDYATLVEQEIASKASMPTTADVERWYQSNSARVQNTPLDQVREPIKAYLIEERMDNAKSAFIARLKEKTRVVVSLVPPRLKIATDGHAAKGAKDAPIEMVEFSDFQCPFCARAHGTLKQVLTAYGDKIRFIYRHYPLPNHPNARPAAEASACALEQDRFWQYHDQLFANTSKLSDADLKAHAASAGLDTGKFAACFDNRKYKGQVDRDVQEAGEAGVTGTPAFFINGRPLEGAQPFEAFKRVIEEELTAKK
jgi:protein-disulfide isomerase